MNRNYNFCLALKDKLGTERSSTVECLSAILKVLGSIPSTAK